MAKDPAILFYTSDFLSGVTFLTMEQRGQYITLLCIQHQHGSIPENYMIFICGSLDSPVIKKFVKDSDGTYYNIRLREEAEKRRRYSESRSNNKKNKTKNDKNKIISSSYDNHMENENINDNLIKDKKEKKRDEKLFIEPTIENVKKYFSENGYSEESAERAFKYYSIAGWKDSSGKQVKNWKQKMISVWFKEENKKKEEYKLSRT